MGKSSKVRTLSAQVSADEYKLYEAIAKSNGQSLSAWVKHTLSAMYPPDVYTVKNPAGVQHQREAAPAAIDLPSAKSVMGVAPVQPGDDALALEDALYASVSVADAQERNAFGSILPMGEQADPAASPARVQARQPIVTEAAPATDHSCAHLSRQLPGNLTWADCQGSCSRQHGRPCHWPSQAASQCPVFRPRRVLPIAGG